MARPTAIAATTHRHAPARALTRRALGSLAAATAVALLAACGSGSEPAASPSSPAPAASAASFPVTVTSAGSSVTLDAAPTRIVSLSPSSTEMLFAIGAGSQVKAVDDQSNFPQEAPRTKLSGFQPNAEAVAAYQPDLVVYSDDLNGLAKALATLKVPALQLPAAVSLDDAYTQLTTLGTATGHTAEAAQTVRTMKSRIDAAIASVPAADRSLSVYHEVDNTYYSLTSSTFAGAIYQKFGLTNIADKAPGAAGGYPQLSAEYIAQRNPGLVVLADGSAGETPSTFAKRAAFGSLAAVTSGRVLVIDADIASRWGPRVADFAEAVASGLKQG
jgi:iron complex transport system substrate-binding protein